MLPDWKNHKVVLISGQHEKRTSPFQTMSLGELNAIVTLLGPTTLPKGWAKAIIPSAYHQADARNSAVQQEHGRYYAIIIDNDSGGHRREAFQSALDDVLPPHTAYFGYSTASASAENPKWRVLIPINEGWPYQDWGDAGEVIYRWLADKGIVADRSMIRASQISFLPNVPPERCDAKGQPLFYESFERDGDGLSWEEIAADVDELRASLREEKHFNEALTVIASSRQDWATGIRDSLIDRFNAANDLSDLLIHYGYEQSPRSKADWRSPMQTSETYATRVTNTEEGRQIFITLSASDAEAGIGKNAAGGSRWGDAFDLFVHFEHDGNFKAAIKSAALALDIAPFSAAGPIPDQIDRAKTVPMPAPFRGEMAALVEAALAVSNKAQPDCTMVATLIGMASACSGHYALPSGARVNLYALVVGKTGSGKDMPQSVVRALAKEAGVRQFGEAGSGQGLEDHLVSYTGSLMIVDEISTTLAATCAKNAPAHLRAAEGMYLKLFSASRSFYTTRLLANTGAKGSGRTIEHSCLSLLGFSTPDGLGEALGEGAITSGLLGRMLMARAQDNVPLRRIKGQFLLPDSVREKLGKFSLAAVPSLGSESCITIQIPAEVDARLDALAKQFDEAMSNAPTEGERALLVRSYEKAERIAGVLAIWDNPSEPLMTQEMVDWAEGCVRASDAALLTFVRRYMHGSPTHANAARVLEVMAGVLQGKYTTTRAAELKAIKSGFAPGSLVLKNCRTMDKTAFELAVGQLIAQGDIVAQQFEGDGIRVLAFRADEGG